MIDVNQICFHDAGLVDAKQTASDIVFEIEAAQYGEYSYNGFLHLEGVTQIKGDDIHLDFIRKYKDLGGGGEYFGS